MKGTLEKVLGEYWKSRVIVKICQLNKTLTWPSYEANRRYFPGINILFTPWLPRSGFSDFKVRWITWRILMKCRIYFLQEVCNGVEILHFQQIVYLMRLIQTKLYAVDLDDQRGLGSTETRWFSFHICFPIVKSVTTSLTFCFFIRNFLCYFPYRDSLSWLYIIISWKALKIFDSHIIYIIKTKSESLGVCNQNV